MASNGAVLASFDMVYTRARARAHREGTHRLRT
ncbi:hypothetical protein SEA_YUMA_1 [Microbacterium phage Yuma]|nr:hypothetical protein SEA_YUMA_1 [Microbacterium phage Yuma]